MFPQAWGYREENADPHRTPEVLHPMTQGTRPAHQLLGYLCLPARQLPDWHAVPQPEQAQWKPDISTVPMLQSKADRRPLRVLKPLHLDVLDTWIRGGQQALPPPRHGRCLPCYILANLGRGGGLLPCPAPETLQGTYALFAPAPRPLMRTDASSWVRAGRRMLVESWGTIRGECVAENMSREGRQVAGDGTAREPRL